MAVKTLTQLGIDARVIKEEVSPGANTATRVGEFMENFLDSFDTILGDGWSFTLDSTTGATNGISVAGGVRTQLLVDGTGGHLHSPNWTANNIHIWDVDTSIFQPLAANDFYSMRLAITGQSDVPTDNRFDVEFDVGGTDGVIARETGVFVKGQGSPQSWNFSTGFFAGGDFLTNGGKIYIIPEGNATFWQLAVTISRTYTPIV